MASIRAQLFATLGSVLLVAGTASAAPVDPRLYDSLHWRLLGPFRAGWAEMIEGVPSKPDTFYFGASGGGVWRTDDAGNTWTSVFDRGGSSAIGAIAIAPSDPNIIYAGGGQPEPRYDVQAGRGVYRSSDGGKTWADLGLHDTRYIGRIWVSPTNPNLVVVGAVGSFFGSSDARGIYRSTDGGRTWSHPLAPGGFTGVNDVVADRAQSTGAVRFHLGCTAMAVAELFHRDLGAGQWDLALGRQRRALASVDRWRLANRTAWADRPGGDAKRQERAPLRGHRSRRRTAVCGAQTTPVLTGRV